MELQFDRYREVAGIDRHALTDDPLATGLEEVQSLIQVLRTDDTDRRIAAIGRLGVFREPVAAGALAQRLANGENREERVAAAIALGACGTRDSLPALLDALADPEPLVAQAAAVALENLTGHREPIEAFAEPEQRGAQIAAWRTWIEQHGAQQMEQKLIARLKSPDRNVVRRAAVALGHTGTLAAAPALRRYLREHRNDNPYPDWKKTHKVDGTQFNATEEVNPRTLQAVARAIGYLGDQEAIGLLAETLDQHNHPDTGNLFLAEACVEALGRIGTPEAQAALVAAYKKLDDYPKYTLWYGDHPALMACHASPVHYFIVEGLDRLGSTTAGEILPNIIGSLPVDQDRALLLPNDDCETLTGRVIRRHGAEKRTVETCLAMLGESQATADPAIEPAVAHTHRCWGGHPGPEIRAAQVLSLTCRDPGYAPRVLAALERYRARTVDIPRVFDRGIPVVEALPVKNWVCFYLARTLGNLEATETAAPLAAVLKESPPEAAGGHPDPLGPGVLFLHNGLTPCWRAAVAWALGQIGDRQAVPVLLGVVADLKNAPDTRHAAAEALGRIADPQCGQRLSQLADGYPEESTRRALVKAARKCREQQRLAVTESSP
jgi:HEAT repeat protein